MKKRTQKAMSLLLVVTLLFGLVACGNAEKDEVISASVPGEQAAVTETATATATGWSNDDEAEITILSYGDNTPNEDNIVIQELEKQTNTKINIIYVPKGDYDTKLNAMLAAGQIPDIFYCENVSNFVSLKEAGLLANMKDVLTAVAPNVLAETKDIINKVALNNDGIYLVPNANKSYATNVNIRTDWLENLGLEMPTDLESFAQVMHAFTYDDPDGNGIDDTFGYSFNLSRLVSNNRCGANIFGAYGIAKGKEMVMEDGTVTTWVKHPHFLEAMKYIKGLVDDGVCEPDYVTIPDLAMFEKLWTGTSGCLEWECVGPTNNWMPGRYTEDPVPTFDFAVLEGPYGDHGTVASYPSINSGWVFSSECKNLEGAARIANFIMSEEGSNLLFLGVEGVMYNWVDKEAGKIERIGEYVDDATHRANGGYCYWMLFQPYSTAEIRTLNAQTREGVQLAHDNAIEWAQIAAVSEVYTEYGTDMDQLISEMIAELLTTDTEDMQDVYDEYIAEWESIGGSDWEAEVTELWNAQNQ